jgi:hypothetical protein
MTSFRTRTCLSSALLWSPLILSTTAVALEALRPAPTLPVSNGGLIAARILSAIFIVGLVIPAWTNRTDSEKHFHGWHILLYLWAGLACLGALYWSFVTSLYLVGALVVAIAYGPFSTVILLAAALIAPIVLFVLAFIVVPPSESSQRLLISAIFSGAITPGGLLAALSGSFLITFRFSTPSAAQVLALILCACLFCMPSIAVLILKSRPNEWTANILWKSLITLFSSASVILIIWLAYRGGWSLVRQLSDP